MSDEKLVRYATLITDYVFFDFKTHKNLLKVKFWSSGNKNLACIAQQLYAEKLLEKKK